MNGSVIYVDFSARRRAAESSPASAINQQISNLRPIVESKPAPANGNQIPANRHVAEPTPARGGSQQAPERRRMPTLSPAPAGHKKMSSLAEAVTTLRALDMKGTFERLNAELAGLNECNQRLASTANRMAEAALACGEAVDETVKHIGQTWDGFATEIKNVG